MQEDNTKTISVKEFEKALRTWNFPRATKQVPLGPMSKLCIYIYMGVSKNKGTPKWMVKIMENPIKMDDLGVPLFSETSI